MTHTLLWSRSRNVVRVVTLAELLSENRIAYTEQRSTDWLPIAVDTEAVCREAAQAVRSTLDRRSMSEPIRASAELADQP